MKPNPLPRVAYFCMEYGLDSEFPIYSGGLGVLAGDHMKSANDLGRPITGIGLLWSEGYTTQVIGETGVPEDHYPATPRHFVERVADVRIQVTVRGRAVDCAVYRVRSLRKAPLYLLEPIADEDKWITRRLYGGGSEDRLAQEILLGVGGVRLLDALGIQVDLFHFNEGHAVFAGLELLRRSTFGGASLDERLVGLRKHLVFTTHTPVAAGNEVHSLEQIRSMSADLGFTDAELTRLGGSPFSMTEAGLRMACRANAVAELHGDTSRKMWKHVKDGAPITHITNGVHAHTWQDARIRAALVAEKSSEDQDRELLIARQQMKRELIDQIAQRSGITLREDRLLVGFARRAAVYKRSDLIFGDEGRLAKLFEDERLQLVFSGKAHPRDNDGKALVTRLFQASRRFPKNVVFLENYSMDLGALLTRGVDAWLNNPRRPMEASGTSGMKAAMNGVPNVSILDGWWPEGCEHGVTGWRIGQPVGDDAIAEVRSDEEDRRDRDALYDVLEREVLPTYYAGGQGWLNIMKASIAMSQWRFSSDRMVEDYFRVIYDPK